MTDSLVNLPSNISRGTNFPKEELSIYLNYVRKLGFEEAPDYTFLKELFTKALQNAGELDDGIYDWNLLNGWS